MQEEGKVPKEKEQLKVRVSKNKRLIYQITKVLIIEGLALAVLLMCISMKRLADELQSEANHGVQQVSAEEDVIESKEETPSKDPVSQKEEAELLAKQEREQYLLEANNMAASYDYEKAIEYVKAYKEDYNQYEELLEAIAGYEKQKAECKNFGAYDSVSEVNHIFFHSLIYDTSKAFDDQYDSNGYNYYMTTVVEFKEMMRQMHEAGFVLVSIHDLVRKVQNEDGTYTYTEGEVMLPPDKKPFVLSQDDVNYYQYMKDDGFATRVVIDQNGRPSTEMRLEDGTTSVGDYDLIPVLETFIEEHPDFSYRGARGIIALTGYEGALGYRTDPASKDSKTYDQDRETVTEIAKVMREWGWEFANHSNGHRNMAECTQDYFEYDTNQWLEHVGSLVGATDLYVYPFGIDIQSGVGTYSNEKYLYLKKSGFSIFFGVEAKPWMQIKKNYVRMQRRPLDGQALLQYPERLKDLFDIDKVIDVTRPALQ